MSSLSFLGNATSYLRIPNTTEFDFGTGDFTIEWYQYQRDTNPFPRIFQVGEYVNGIVIGVSIEGGTLYYWRRDLSQPRTAIALPNSYKNIWVHFAISRSSGITKVFMNGTSIYSMSDTVDFTQQYNAMKKDLIISNESTPANNSAFGGYISYFSWVKGVSLYTTNFTVSNDPPTLTNNHVLLLTASSFDGTLGNTVINNNVSTIQNTPSNSPPNNNNNNDNNNNNNNNAIPPNRINLKSSKPLFTDNSLVFYKPGSMASCGVGSVRNSSIKSRRI